MSETIVLGIRITGDSKDVVAAARQAQTELDKIRQTGKQSGQEAARGADQFTASLRKQADTLGMTRSQVLGYEAAQHNLNAGQREMVAGSIQAIDAHERQERMLGRVRIAAAAAGTALGVALVAGLKGSVAAATEAEQAELRLQAVVKATGGVAGLTAQELTQMAGAFQDRLGINDEAVKGSMAVLLTFRSVSRESFGEALEVAANLSKVMGTDLQSATLQLGKALEEPEQGLAALRRSGVSFTDTQKDVIKELVETGNQAQAITLILKIMKEQGLDKVAESMNQGLHKATNTLKNEWDDMLEAFGRTAVVKVPVEETLGSWATQMRAIKNAIEGDWVDKFLLVASALPGTPGGQINALINARGNLRQAADGPTTQDLDDAEIGAAGRRVDNAREAYSAFMKQFRSDNEKLGEDLRKLGALYKAGEMSLEQYAADEAKIREKYAKPQQKTEYDQLIKSVREKSAVQQAELEGQAKLTEAEQIAMKAMVGLRDGTLKLTEAQKISLVVELERALAIDQSIKNQQAQRAITDLLAAASLKNAAAIQTEADAHTARFKSANDNVKQIEFETQLIGLSNAEREKAIALRALETSGIDKESEAYKHFSEQLGRAIDAKAAKQKIQDVIDETKNAAKRMDEDLQRGLTDSIFRGFEAGKPFAENFRDSLVNMFKTTILRPVVQFLVSPITGAATAALGSLGIPGLANAAGGAGGLDMLSSAANLVGGAGLLGSAAAYSTITGGSMAAGSQAALLAAQTGEFGAAGLAATAGASGTMTALAAAAPYIGAAIAVGSALGVFGGGGDYAQFVKMDVSGTANRGGVLGSQWLAHNTHGDVWETSSHGAIPGMNASIAGIFADMEKIAQALGRNASALNAAQVSFGFTTTGKSNQGSPSTGDVLASFNANLGQISDQLARTVMPNLQDFAQAGETATQTLVRMVQAQEQLRAAQAQQTDQLKGMVQGLPGALGITALRQAQNALAISDSLAPLDRLGAAQRIRDETYARAFGGDLAAVQAFPEVLQSTLAIARDVGASGSLFQDAFVEGNKQLNDLLSRQQNVQSDLLKNIDVSIVQAAQDQTAELIKIRQALAVMNAQLQATQAELRRIAA